MSRWKWPLVLALAACGGGGDDVHVICRGPVPCTLDSGPVEPPLGCSALTQVGCQATEKCSWVIDATVPTYVGHVGCVPDGTRAVGAACEYGAAGATGYDSCAKGGVCSAYEHPGTQGVCKAICDNQGGNPMCDSDHVCVVQPDLFSTGATSPAAAGVCEQGCDPLADNDFDGSAGSQMRTGRTCGSDPQVGCYGFPSGGIPPATGWSCLPDIHSNPDKGLRHRVECTPNTGCADPDGTIYANSCNQGYLPLMRESTAVSTTVCIALCAPLDCYAGHCGGSDVNERGASPHRCMSPDAVGNFGSDEECQYLWRHELDGSGNYLPSPWSNTVGFCVDHAAYGLPSCKDLPLHGSGSALGADDLGCVSTTTAAMPVTSQRLVELPRTLYHRVMR